MENKWIGAVGGRERPVCVRRAFAPSNPHSWPAEIETRLRYFSLLARNHRVTKSVGCHKRAKPGGERWLGGGGSLRNGDAREDSQIHLVLIRQSGKQMSAVSEGGEAGGEEGWSVDLLGRIYCLACPISPPPPPSFFSCSISAFPSRLKQQFVARGKNEREEEATKEGVFAPL